MTIKILTCIFAFSFIIIAKGQNQDYEIASCVKNFRIKKDEDFSVLRKNPAESCLLLLNELQVISEVSINGYFKNDIKYKKAMHIIDCIRALRALTGQKFYGKTTYRFNPEKDKDRISWLFREYKDKVPFFANWMSRDSEFIAPEDAQVEIISQWKKWYEENKQKKSTPILMLIFGIFKYLSQFQNY